MSVRLKLILGVSIILLLLLFILINKSLQLLEQTSANELIKRANSSADHFARTMKDAVLSTDLATLDSFAKEVTDGSDLVYVRIYDAEIKLVEAGDRKSLERPFSPDEGMEAIDDGIFDTYAEIIEANNVLGRIELGISTSQLQSTFSDAREEMISIARYEIYMAVFLAILLGSFLVGKLRRLTEASERIAQGDLGYTIKVSGHDEIAMVMKAFNKMSASLNKSNLEIRKQHLELLELGGEKDELLKTVSTRRKELESKNVELEKEIIKRKLAENAQKTAHDILEVRIRERTLELTEANKMLRQEIEDRKKIEKALGEAKNDAEVASTAKSEFLANMSHEIRTPMNAIIGLSNLAFNLEMPPKVQQYMETIRFSADSLLRIINSILDFSKIEAGKIELEYVDFNLSELMDHVADMFVDKAADKNIELAFNVTNDVPHELQGDPVRLGQIIINLMANALKFTEEGNIVFSVACQKKSKDKAKLLFSIEDTGCGIEKKKLDSLFKAFSQVDSSTTRKYGGTGLGLAISKQLVEMMGGKISVKSKLKKGSTFSFGIELGLTSDSVEKDIPGREIIAGITVLIVDDNEVVQTILKRMLQSFGILADSAYSAEKGLEVMEANLAGKKPYDLILMDWKLPGMDGIEATRIIRENKKTADTPVIMATAFGREEQKKQAEDVGVNAFIMKPVKRSKLYDVMLNVLGYSTGDIDYEENKKVNWGFTDYELLRGAKILLVEDNRINQQVAREILEPMGIDVTTANNGSEALEELNGDYDAVLMDVQMPVMDGLEATRVIRKKKKFNKLPIIAMTAHAMEGDKAKCLETGMNDYVAKPIDPEQLFSVLQKWIQPQITPQKNVERTEKKPSLADKFNLPEDLPQLDIKKALRRIGNKEKTYLKLLKDFEVDFKDSVKRLRKSFKNKAFQDVTLEAHTLKGVAGNLGATKVYENALLLEKDSKGKNFKGLDAHLKALDQNIKELLVIIKDLTGNFEKETAQAKKNKGSIKSKKQLKILFEELDGLMRNNNAAAEDFFDSLKDRIHLKGAKAKVQAIGKNLSSFDFTKARENLKELAEKLDIKLEAKSND